MTLVYRESTKSETMKIYEVGGAVRDELLGLPVKDRDYVVVGSTPEEMTRLGYTPVGKDFPVFLHPSPTLNTPSPAPNAKRRAAIMAFRFMRRRM